jgi:hypothetical protein
MSRLECQHLRADFIPLEFPPSASPSMVFSLNLREGKLKTMYYRLIAASSASKACTSRRNVGISIHRKLSRRTSLHFVSVEESGKNIAKNCGFDVA